MNKRKKWEKNLNSRLRLEHIYHIFTLHPHSHSSVYILYSPLWAYVRRAYTRALFSRHNDLPWNIRKFIHNQLHTVNFTYDLRNVSPWSTSKWSHTDLNRLRQGMVGAQMWVAYAPCGAQHKDAVQVTLEQIDLIKRLVSLYPRHLAFVNDSVGLETAHREGRTASLISVESGHAIGTSLAVLRMFHRLGAISLTLTHNCNTPWFVKPAVIMCYTHLF